MILLRQNRTFAILLATIVLMELAHGIEIVTLLPLYLTRHFGEGEAFVGLVASTYLLVDSLLTRTPAGMLSDRWGRKPTLAVGILLSLAPLPAMMLATDPRLFVPLSALNGLGAGMVWPPIYAMVADLYPRAQRGTVLGLVNMVMLGGLAAGGPITGSIILALLNFPDPAAFPRGLALCTAFVFAAFILVMALVRETRTRMHVEPARPPDQAREWNRTGWLLLAIGLFISLALGLIVPILTLFGANVLHVTLGEFALIMIPPALTAAVVLLPAGRWADRRGRSGPLLLGLVAMAVPFCAAAASTAPFIVSAGGMTAAFGYGLFVPAWNALVMDWVPPDRRGLYLGGVATLQGLGLAAGPVIGGRLFELDPYAPFWGAGALLTLSAVLAWLYASLAGSAKLTRLKELD